jgi:WD40 repeat protein
MKNIWMRKFPEISLKQYFGSYSADFDHPPLFFTGSGDDTVRIWEVASQQQVAQLEGHTDTVMSVAFDSSGKYLASGEIA